MSGGKRAVVLASVLLLLSCGVASADINVNVTGWWRTGDAFNASGTPIQHAINNATSGETLGVYNGTYTETPIDIVSKSFLTVQGSGSTIIQECTFTIGGCVSSVTTDNITVSNIIFNTTQVNLIADTCDPSLTMITKDCTIQYCDFYGKNMDINPVLGLSAYVGSYKYGNVYLDNNLIDQCTFTTNITDMAYLGTMIQISSRPGYTGDPWWSTSEFRNNTISNCEFIYNNTGASGYCELYGISWESSYDSVDNIFDDLIFTDISTLGYDTKHDINDMPVNNTITQSNHRLYNPSSSAAINQLSPSENSVLLTETSDLDSIPFLCAPSSSNYNVSMLQWNTTDDYKKQFNITGTSGTFTYTIGDMLPNTDAKISTDTWSDTKTADWAGEITGTYNGGWSTKNFTVLSITPPPTSIQHTTGNFWVNHTWQPGAGTDGYNVSVNNVWHNSTAAHYNDSYSAHAWQNITVWAWNSSMGMSAANITQDTQIPNNPITITDTADWIGNAGDNVSVDYNSTDLDSDTPTYSCSRTDLFTDFSTVTGTGNWTPSADGTYYVDFGVSDGYGSTSNYTMTIRVGVSGIQTETKVPVSIFIALTVLMLCGILYMFHAKSHISRIFTTLIATWMAFMLSQMIVSGNVVQMVSALDSADVWSHDTVAIQIPALSYLLLFIGVILSIFLVKFVVVFGLAVIKEAQREEM